MTRAPDGLELLELALRARSPRAIRRALEVLLGLRRLTPRPGEELPRQLVHADPADTGGGVWRASHRPQDPAKDPREPGGGESSSRGTDHGWANCTMSSGADAVAYGTHGELTPWGGDLRHAQSDLEGGTDLGDLDRACAELGVAFSIRSGQGWEGVKQAHADRRCIVIQGTGEVPGAGSFAGGHACSIAPESHSDGRWLFGDPLVSDWQWIEPSAIRSWAERWSSSIAFGVTAPLEDPAPDPEPDPECPECPPAEEHTPAELEELEARAAEAAVVAAGDALVGEWLEWLRAPAGRPADAWDAGAWASAGELLELALVGDPCAEPGQPARWARGPVLPPVRDAWAALTTPATWDGGAWRGLLWAA